MSGSLWVSLMLGGRDMHGCSSFFDSLPATSFDDSGIRVKIDPDLVCIQKWLEKIHG
jgi:hypothetical protein